MNRFEFARPASVADAVALLSEKHDESVALAGGTDLLSLMKDFVVEPKRLVSLMGIGELRGIQLSGGSTGDPKNAMAKLRIGATTTLDELLANAEVKSNWPALWQAAAGIKSPQLRTMGTVGGELLQRPRCWYFRHGHGLCAEWNGESLPVKGDNRYHAVFDNAGPAKFVNASSLAPALIAYKAWVEVNGFGGGEQTIETKDLNRTPRKIEMKDLYRTPKSAAERETTLAANEIVTAIVLPQAPMKSATYEIRPRQGLDWPLATASVWFRLEGTKVAAAMVVLGHVAPTPWIAEGATTALVGQELNAKTIAAAANAAVVGATPLSKNAYKVDLAKVAVRRALTAAAGI